MFVLWLQRCYNYGRGVGTGNGPEADSLGARDIRPTPRHLKEAKRLRRFDTLYPCPCCGGRPVVLVQSEGGAQTVRVECSECKLSTPSIIYARRGSYDERRRLMDLGVVLDLQRARDEAAAIWCRRADAR